MENVVGLLSLVLKDSTDLEAKLATEEGVAEVKEQLTKLVIRTPEENNSFIANIQENYKDKMHGQIHGAAMEKNEKELMKAFEMEGLQHGVDFNNNIELVRKIVEAKSTTTSAEPSAELEQAKAEAEALRGKFKDLTESTATQLEEAQKAANNRIANAQLDMLVNSYKDSIDAEDEAKDGQLEFLKFQFQKNYDISMDGDQIIVVDKEGNPVTDDVMAKKSLSDVVSENASKYLTIKESSAFKGRGNDKNDKSTPADGSINWSKYGNDFDTYYNDELKGKGISMGSVEATEAYQDFVANAAG